MGTPLIQEEDSDMVNKAKSKEASERRWRAGRLSMRAHTDLKRALKFLADADNRTVSQYVEIVLLAHVQGLLKNQFDASGALTSGNRGEPLAWRKPRHQQTI